MSTAVRPLPALEATFARDLPELCLAWQGDEVPEPQALTLNGDLAAELGLDAQALATPEGVAILAGAAAPEGATPVAQAYAGHQFGGYSPRLGDGRALLLGELLDVHGRRRDLHLKGSGATPFSRGGDGKAAVGPMLREHVVSEALHALGIPTTRALAVVATGEQVRRETLLPGAVLARVAASHIRVGTFQYAAANAGPEVVRRLADHAIARHHPDAAQDNRPYLAFFTAVVEAQASLIAQWMLVGFVHGVMNTDNMTISGESIDFGPCAFMDAFDPETTFSSIDHGRRYAFGNQPHVAPWNLARLAESLVPLVDDDPQAAVATLTEVLQGFPERFHAHWEPGMRAKLALPGDRTIDDEALADDLLRLMHAQRADYTTTFRGLAHALRGHEAPARARFDDPAALTPWLERWRAELARGGADPADAAAAMDRVNPVYVPRNHVVEDALVAATVGDLAPVRELLQVVADPFTSRPGLERYAEPAPDEFTEGFRTFCGT